GHARITRQSEAPGSLLEVFFTDTSRPPRTLALAGALGDYLVFAYQVPADGGGSQSGVVWDQIGSFGAGLVTKASYANVLDVVARGPSIYWIDSSTAKVFAGDLDGREPTILAQGENDISSMALNDAGLYWTRFGDGLVRGKLSSNGAIVD